MVFYTKYNPRDDTTGLGANKSLRKRDLGSRRARAENDYYDEMNTLGDKQFSNVWNPAEREQLEDRRLGAKYSELESLNTVTDQHEAIRRQIADAQRRAAEAQKKKAWEENRKKQMSAIEENPLYALPQMKKQMEEEQTKRSLSDVMSDYTNYGKRAFGDISEDDKSTWGRDSAQVSLRYPGLGKYWKTLNNLYNR